MIFSDQWKENLLSHIDLVSLIGEYVQIHSMGDKFKACCPFHSEKTPSFVINQNEKYYFCFGCHASGDAITFIMKKENLSYVEALEYLAKKYSVELPPQDESTEKRNKKYESIFKINIEVAKFYNDTLLSKKGEAYDYLINRGINEKLIYKFGLGLSPNYEGVKNHMIAKGFSDKSLFDAGILNKQMSDNFAKRLIIPIIDEKSRVIAFGGRAINKGQNPKYKNSTNTLVFDKSKALYGINFIKKLSQDKLEHIILVEGYMDVISLHKFGYENCIASMGTALTTEQCKLIKKYTKKVIVCYDGDLAGQNATMRSLDLLKNEDLEVFIVSIPDGMDPDDYLNKYSKESFDKLIRIALPINDYIIISESKKYNLNSAYGKEKFANDIIKFLATLNPINQENAINLVSEISEFNVESIRNTLKLYNEKNNNSFSHKQTEDVKNMQVINPSSSTSAYSGDIKKKLSIVLEKFFIAENTFIDITALSEEYALDGFLSEVYYYIKAQIESGGQPSIHGLISISNKYNDEESKAYVDRIIKLVNNENHFNIDDSRLQYEINLRELMIAVDYLNCAKMMKQLEDKNLSDKERQDLMEKINFLSCKSY